MCAQGNTPSMDLRDRLEICIPVEAEVKSIPLWSLPNSVLRRMGLPLPDANGSKKLTNSPKGIWICPAVIRKKGQIPGPQTGSGVMENTLSLLGRECRASSGPFQMSFVFSNRTAYRVLKDTTLVSHTPPLPHGPAPRTYQTAVVIYAGRIYLSVRKPSQSQAQRETPQSAVLPFPTVRTQFKRQKKVTWHLSWWLHLSHSSKPAENNWHFSQSWNLNRHNPPSANSFYNSCSQSSRFGVILSREQLNWPVDFAITVTTPIRWLLEHLVRFPRLWQLVVVISKLGRRRILEAAHHQMSCGHSW